MNFSLRFFVLGFVFAAAIGCGDDEGDTNAKDASTQDGGDAGGTGGSDASSEGGSGGGGAGGSESPMDGGSSDAATETPECGNGQVESGEDCDDDNTTKGDGCDDACQFESGWLCSTDEPTTCAPRCGDGKRLGAETGAAGCDDHDKDDGDGCDSDCHVEAGWKCTGTPSVCTLFCGNGVIDNGEPCDDGNNIAGDGCATCTVEAHWSCTGAPSACTAEIDANVIVSGLQLAALPTRKPSAIQAPVALTGVVTNDMIMAIDRRPMNGMLYGLGYNGTNGTVQLYLISSQSGVCTPLGTAAKFVASDGTTPLNVSGTQFGMDFNPNVDRIRVVTNQSQNFRMNPNTGALIDGAGPTGTQPDASISGATTTVDECAYTNNGLNQTATTLYTLDHATRALYIQNPPNEGVQTMSVSLPLTVNFVWGFDIAAGVNVATSNAVATGTGFAVITEVGATQSALARVNLTSGAVSNVTAIGTNILGLALQNLDAIPMIALTSDGAQLLHFNDTDPGGAVAVPVVTASLASGETLVDIDYRPATGQLMGLGVNPTADTASLYVVDPSTGALALVGSASQIAFESSGNPVDFPASALSWSIDFNPQVDRLRVMTSEGLNFRVNPTTGAPVDGESGPAGVQPDATLSGLGAASQGAAGAAYTNSWTGATVTTMYVLDAAGNQLCRSSNPNVGTVTGCVPITSGGQALDIVTSSEADFAGDVRTTVVNEATTGVMHAVVSVAGKGHLFSIDLATGAATDRGQIGTGPELSGFAVGHATVK